MKIGIHGKEFNEETGYFIKKIFEKLEQHNAQLLISADFSYLLDEANLNNGAYRTYRDGQSLDELDCFITLGGDGTLLEAVTHVNRSQVPMLGINTGRLGFLATTARGDYNEAIESLFRGEYTYDDRTLLRLESNTHLFDGLNFALNDFAILKQVASSMIVVHTFINGEFLNSYWADGVVVSTPTGSTGYSISCGGPLVLPRSNNFILTPVSPHNLTVRPMVVPDSSELSFKIEGRTKNFLLSLDSRYETVDDTVELTVKKEDFSVRLIKLPGSNYFQTLRQKLNWGLDIRN